MTRLPEMDWRSAGISSGSVARLVLSNRGFNRAQLCSGREIARSSTFIDCSIAGRGEELRTRIELIAYSGLKVRSQQCGEFAATWP
jgi:hypothetical protein